MQGIETHQNTVCTLAELRQYLSQFYCIRKNWTKEHCLLGGLYLITTYIYHIITVAMCIMGMTGSAASLHRGKNIIAKPAFWKLDSVNLIHLGGSPTTVKKKKVPTPAMKAYKGNGGIAPLILNLGSKCRYEANFTHLPFCPRGKSPRYPLNGRLGGGPRPVLNVLLKRSVASAGIRTPDSPVRRLLTVLITLNRLPPPPPQL